MLPLRSLAFLMSFFGLSTVSLVVPILGIANYILIYLIFPEHTWWHVPLQPLGIRYSMTAAVCMMFGLLFYLPNMPWVRPRLSVWDTMALGLVAVVILSEFTGLRPSRQSAYLTSKFIKMMIFIFCLTRLTTTKRTFEIVLWALVIGTLYIGYDAWTAPRGAFARGRLSRIGGPDFRHSSGLAAHMGAMLPLIAMAFMTSRSWLLRIVSLCAGALTVNTIVLCRTRSAFVGLTAGALAALLLAPKRRRVRIYVAIIVGSFCAYSLTDPLFWKRMSTLQDQKVLRQDQAAMGRVEIWKTARLMIAEHPMGVGIGNFQRTLAEFNPALGRRAAHNTLILCWAELGTHGFGLFLVLVGTSIVQAWQCYRRAPNTEDPVWTRYMAYGTFLAIVVSLGTQMFTERLYTEAFWWVLALPGCLKRVVLREALTPEVELGEITPELSLDNSAGWNDEAEPQTGHPARGAFA